jgi:hypothetical protein
VGRAAAPVLSPPIRVLCTFRGELRTLQQSGGGGFATRRVGGSVHGMVHLGSTTPCPSPSPAPLPPPPPPTSLATPAHHSPLCRQCTGGCPAVLTQAGNCVASVFQYSCQCNSQACTNSTLSVTAGVLRTGAGGGLPRGLASCASHFRAAVAVLWLSAVLSVVFVVLEAAWRWPCATSGLHTCGTACMKGRRGPSGSDRLAARGLGGSMKRR